MAEELRIVLQDEGVAAPAAPATQPVPGAVADAPVTRVPSVPQEQGEGFETKAPSAPAVPPVPKEQAKREEQARQKERFRKVEEAASISQQAISGDFGGAARGLSAFVAGISATTVAVAGVTLGFGLAAAAVRKFGGMVEAEASRLEGVSAPVAQARSQTQIRRELAVIRRGERIGSRLAVAEDVRSRWEDAIFDVWTEIEGAVLRIVESMAPLLKTVADGVQLLAPLVDVAGKLAQGLPYLRDLRLISTILKWFREKFGEDEEIRDDPIMDLFLANLGGLTPAQAAMQTGIPLPPPVRTGRRGR